MSSWGTILQKAYFGYYHYLEKIILHPFAPKNFFYLLIFLSLAVWALELIFPWRKQQRAFRKGFWLDTFYMFFNFFIFNLIVFIALSNTTAMLFGKLMSAIGLPEKGLTDLSFLPEGWELLVFFLISDFTQWGIHNLLHRVPFLWRFHKLHHSVEEMGFAAHLRFHWGETIVYNTIKYIVLAWCFNFKLEYAFYIHAFALLIGHLNHANLGVSYGPLKYVLNNPKMHIWHHAKHLPQSHPKGMNFGISLSLWDYIFRTNYIPHEGRDIPLGFDGSENYPQDFFRQQVKPFQKQ